MYLDPEALAQKALAHAINPGISSEISVHDATQGFTMNERRLVRGVCEAICAELAAMFSDGVGQVLEEQSLLDATPDTHPAEFAQVQADFHALGNAPAIAHLDEADYQPPADNVAADVDGMSWTELKDYAEAHGIDPIDPDTRKPRSKATILELLGVKEAS